MMNQLSKIVSALTQLNKMSFLSGPRCKKKHKEKSSTQFCVTWSVYQQQGVGSIPSLLYPSSSSSESQIRIEPPTISPTFGINTSTCSTDTQTGRSYGSSLGVYLLHSFNVTPKMCLQVEYHFKAPVSEIPSSLHISALRVTVPFRLEQYTVHSNTT